MQRVTTAALGLCLAGSVGVAQTEWPQIHPTRVEVEGTGAEARASVVAVNTSVESLLHKLAEKTDRRLEGFGPDGSPALVTVELVDRPLVQVLEYVLGSVGLSYELQPGVLRIVDGEAEVADVDILEARALAHYLRATTAFPAHEEAAQARLDQGRLEERRGNPSAAFEHYQAMLEGYPRSELVPEARLLSGAVLEHMGRYSEAHTQYLAVTSLPSGDPRRNEARLALARCQLELSNPSFTVLMVRRLEEDEPTGDPVVKSQRLLLLARALERAELSLEALEVLDDLERLGGPVEQALEAMEVRAAALEDLDMLEPAARAWIVVARENTGDPARRAYERAAELSVRAGDELSVLFVAKEAEARELGADLATYVRRARLALGLDVDLASGDVSYEERWQIVQDWLLEERNDRADPELARLFAERREMTPELARDVCLLHARRLYDERGLEPSLAALREARRDLEDESVRAAFDLFAGRLLEGERAYVRAAAAYEGDF